MSDENIFKYPAHFKGKKILVMGLGLHGGGIGTVKFLSAAGAKIVATDLRSKKNLAPALKELKGVKNVSYVLGKHRLKDFEKIDLIIKGPGVRPDSEFLRHARKNNIPVTSDIGIFLSECRAKIIGVTGTRGKSTTAYLIYSFLKTKYRKVYLAGNIRKSVLEILPEIKKEDLVVLELSSFQLQDLEGSGLNLQGKPEITVLTNLYPDHLNWHKDYREYERAKSFIFKFQNKDNYILVGPANKQTSKFIKNASSKKIITPRLSAKLEKIVDKNLGEHHISSVSLALGVAQLLDVSKDHVIKILKNFYGLEGRQEKIRELKNVTFINDTTSTMPQATIAAINRFRALCKNKLILIAGGQDKGLDYKEMAQSIKNKVDFLMLLPGGATKKIIRNLAEYKLDRNFLKNVQSMKEAVQTAYKLSTKNDFILLSPGAASFGLFLNEFDRGEKFIKEVKQLK